MRGKMINRITAGIMALAIVGAALPAEIGHIALFDHLSITANAADYEVSTWADLKSAVENAVNGAVIQLTDNITNESGNSDTSVLKVDNKSITIDLNTYTINRNRTTAHKDGHVFWITSTGNLTVKNGTLTGGYANNGGGINNKGTLTLTNVNIATAGLTIQEMRTDMERVEDVMQYPDDPNVTYETDTSDTLNKLRGEIEFRNVSFGYSKLAEPLIKDFSMHIKQGGRVAFVGASGCGKSTLSKLISGLYEPWSGEILFDGKPRK